MRMHPLTSDYRVSVRALRVEKELGANSPDLKPVDYSIWGALKRLVYHHRRF